MRLTKAQTAAIDTLLDYLAETTRPGHAGPPKHAEAHNALVLLAVAAGHDGNDADARLAATWRDRLNVQRDLAEVERLADRVAELEGERARYVDSYQEWAVKLSGGTHLDCRGEDDARERATAYHARLMVCDVLATDWREVAAAPDRSDRSGR